MSTPPPDGIYVPAVVFLDEHEEIDEAATRAHILRLAEVRVLLLGLPGLT